MDVNAAQVLLGGLTPAAFMRKHWHKAPLLVRQAWPGVLPPVSRAALFELAQQDSVESRLVVQDGGRWRVRQGPVPRRSLPPMSSPGWTILVQGLDLHVGAAHDMLQRFAFIPSARLDDLMASWASPSGGVGPHLDAYDVFLIQVQGRRRWRWGRVADPSWVEGAPLKQLRHFDPTDDAVLEPGDMLYLPPAWGHEGRAEGGDCMTCSVGFRAPASAELARELLLRMADACDEDAIKPRLYRDPRQAATASPAALPEALVDFARGALAERLADPEALARALGEYLSEPKPQTWFDGGPARSAPGAVQLSPRSRMLYDNRHVFINGEAWLVGGRDRTLLRRLADSRRLSAVDRARLSVDAAAQLAQWAAAGWVEAEAP